MGVSTANGHVGRFVAGMLGGKRVLVMQGRLHGYEGYTAQEVAFPVWLMARLGAGTLITTNAAGAISESYRVGDFCIVTDQLNFTGRNPITGTGAPPPWRRGVLLRAGRLRPSPLRTWLAARPAEAPGHSRAGGRLPGPAARSASFETPAEIPDVPLFGAC
ncbi:MAG: hypothetical protein ACLTDR_06775 [Adlercreutzia equolifaciens]